MRKAQAGFTIVELLIVIVVIAILAAITIVAYNGIQRRANNTARVNNSNQAVKLLNTYITSYGKYPVVSGSGFSSCLGNGFYENNTKCWGVDSATPAIRSGTLNDTEMVKVGSLPNNTTSPVQTSAWKGLGPVYIYTAPATVDGIANPLSVMYFLEGASQDCVLPNVIRNVSGDTYITYSTSPRFSYNLGDATVCQVAIQARP